MDYRGQTRGRFERRQLQFAQAVAKHPKMQSALSRKVIDGGTPGVVTANARDLESSQTAALHSKKRHAQICS